MHKKQTSTKNKENISNLTGQRLEKYCSLGQQLAYRGWHQVNSQELLTRRKERRQRNSRAERLSEMGDGGQAAVSLTSDMDGTSPSSLLDSILSILLKKQSNDVW